MYTSDYDLPEIRSSVWRSVDAFIPHLNSGMRVLDIGCGTGSKSVAIASSVSHLDCIDHNHDVLRVAAKKFQQHRIDNVRLCHGDNLALPMKTSSYDACSAFLTTWNAAEIHRVLKTGGLFFVEALSADDKLELKVPFGKDEFGWRGRFLNQTVAEREAYIMHQLLPFFEVSSMRRIEVETTLSKEGMISLLMQTPTIRGFPSKNDFELVEQLTPTNQITFTERRIRIEAFARKVY